MKSKSNLMKSTEKKLYLLYLLAFTGLFVFTALIVFLPFFLEKKSFIWISDGSDQHYTSLLYYSSYMRGILKNLFYNGKLVFPLWDFKIGQGSDIITTLSYYCIGDPLTFFAVFFPKSRIEMFYNFLVVFRIYLCGMSFSAYCFYLKKEKLPTLLGAFTYMFSGYTLVAIKHPFFVNPMIYFPLLLIGIEIILRRGKPYFFTFMVFISAISNFYFLFILTILSVLYAVLSFFLINDLEKNAKTLLKILFKGCLSYLLGIAMAAVFLLPIIEAMTKTYRYADSGNKLFLLYDWKYYIKLLLNFTGKAYGKAWSYLGFAATAIVAVPTLFMIKDKKFKPVKLAFIAAIFFLVIPAAGYVFNGFAYVTNRWVFALSFIVALIFTNVYPYMDRPIDKRILIGAFLWLDIAFAIDVLRMLKGNYVDILYIFPLLLTLQTYFTVSYLRDKLKAASIKYIFFALTIFCICANGFLLYDKHSWNLIRQYVNRGAYLNKVMDSPLKYISKIEDSDFYRTDTYSLSYNKRDQKREMSSNEAMLLDYRGLSTYFSLVNPNYSKFLNQLNVIGATTTYRVFDLDNRTALNELAAVKYSMQYRNSYYPQPYGYEKIKTVYDYNRPVDLYENKYALPLGYTYDSYVNIKSFEKLDTLDKQQLMLENAVLEDNASMDKVKEGSYSSEKIDIPIQKVYHSKIKPTYKNFHNKKVYSLKTVPDSEVYVVVKNVKLKDKKRFNIIAETDTVRKFAKIFDKADMYYFGRDDAVFNLGYTKDSLSKLMVYTDKKGKFTYEKISVFCLPMKNYSDKIGKLKENVLTDVKMTTNEVTGSINSTKAKLLCLSIPYSEGWKAAVDGKEVPIYKANLMYMAISVDKGKHVVELRYSTPGLVEGAKISAVSLIVFLFLSIFRFKINFGDREI
ncbi:YfhO family protein [Clostridium oryzae]|uniref:Bacterial membrane protein YfhO n=1 Tax=Clostridium oryzae TaxID=1450648 RepID=A0A1V4INC4_9CLOT|nr:YfhO family protein [Clostridium oryzae]OPJ61393.1 bacterial membrane protein YfhO [Clostridium oryzae]